ncbi:hypothetical protein [Methylorubrum aminovorans]|uniref:hypothetical protein n=1 Tax=Methylorubrum aminovorans TaxID=269069 RepID=UPI003C2E3287
MRARVPVVQAPAVMAPAARPEHAVAIVVLVRAAAPAAPRSVVAQVSKAELRIEAQPASAAVRATGTAVATGQRTVPASAAAPRVSAAGAARQARAAT